MEETSLDQFVDADAGAGRESDGPAEDQRETAPGEDAERGEPPEPDDGATAPTPTMSFAPDGAACSSCGRSVRRRWHAEEGALCADCQAW